jgi:HPt (histidine-containing phosphotransfer) domain-containing protein
VADWEKALATWQDPLVYAHALKNFAEQHAADAANIMRILNKSPENSEEIGHITHALKGVAGNLALLEIAKRVIEIDAAFKTGHLHNSIEQLCNLDTALTKTVSAIQRLQLPDTPTNITVSKPFDTERVVDLLQQMHLALDALNPEIIEPVMQKLAPYLIETDLKSIRRQIDCFDFDSAKSVVEQLIDRLANQLKGV